MSQLFKSIGKNRAELYITLCIWSLELPINFFLWFSEEASPTLYPPTLINVLICISLYLLFIAGYLIFYRYRQVKPNGKKCLAGLFLLALAWLCLSMMFFFSMVALMSTIILAQLVSLIKQKWTILLGILIPLLAICLDVLLGKPFEFIPIILYSIINTLALLSGYRLMAELTAKNESQRLVHELIATQMLLSASTKREERLRIARDLHDTLGHQLTALSLQLEVATHVKEEDKQNHIEQAKDISRLLLSGVRESVSKMRHEKDVELNDLLLRLCHGLPGLKVDLKNKLGNITINNPVIETIFRCVQEALTNIHKHCQANRCTIELTNNAHKLFLSIKDNGQLSTNITPGNGLVGMQERVNNMGGELSYTNSTSGFQISISLPID